MNSDSLRDSDDHVSSQRRHLPDWALALTSHLRIRQKLILLHTLFSFALAAILLLSIRPAIRDLVATTEAERSRLAVRLLEAAPGAAPEQAGDGLSLVHGGAGDLGIDRVAAAQAKRDPGSIVMTETIAGWPMAVVWDAAGERFLSASPRSPAARRAVLRLYTLIALVLLAVYGLIALTVEVFVLPQHVYRPIRRLQEADHAAQEGRSADELIADRDMPSDELGEIMRSRNAVITRFRLQERQLADALAELERIASDLKVKNHLLEHAKRNMADQDRLASLGMMSAGVAHELNTPLAVLKGLAEQIAQSPAKGIEESKAQLMLRVVQRLERLSASLLDFARAGPAGFDETRVASLVEEAWTLVRLDRDADNIRLASQIPDVLAVVGNEDRFLQVFVNLLRNAVDAMNGAGDILVRASVREREGGAWISVTIADTGPGVDPAVLPRLFEPFVSTRLDANGAGLGLAVADGIVRRHGGVIAARNKRAGGAEFEVILPAKGETENAKGAAPNVNPNVVESGA